MLRFLRTGFDTGTLISLPSFIAYLFTCVHNKTEPDFLPFLNSSSASKWKKTKTYKSEYRAGNITQWFSRAIKLFVISVKVYVAIMVKATFEINSNI